MLPSMSPYDETRPYQDDRTRPRRPDDPTAPLTVPPALGAATPPPRRDPPRWLVGTLALGCVALVALLVFLLLSNHSSGNTVASTHTSTGVMATALATLAPTQTATLATCNALDEFRQASAPDPNSRHFVLAFPAGMVGVSAGSDAEAQGYAHRTLHLCVAGTTIALADRLTASFAAGGWQPLALSDPLAANGGCQSACWRQSFAVTGGSVRELVGLGAVATRGGAQTAPLTLTITPFSAGAHTLSNAAPTFNFAADTTIPPDIQLASGGITLLDNAVYAALPGNVFDIMYTQVRALDYTNPGHAITLTTNSAIALKGNSGKLSKLLVTHTDAGGMTLTWVTYPSGF